MSEGFEHLPVMVDEVVDLFRPVPPGLIVDATVGGGSLVGMGAIVVSDVASGAQVLPRGVAIPGPRS